MSEHPHPPTVASDLRAASRINNWPFKHRGHQPGNSGSGFPHLVFPGHLNASSAASLCQPLCDREGRIQGFPASSSHRVMQLIQDCDHHMWPPSCTRGLPKVVPSNWNLFSLSGTLGERANTFLFLFGEERQGMQRAGC